MAAVTSSSASGTNNAVAVVLNASSFEFSTVRDAVKFRKQLDAAITGTVK